MRLGCQVCVPGDPANSARAVTTVFCGMTVLSAILAQSLMIVNFPCNKERVKVNELRRRG